MAAQKDSPQVVFVIHGIRDYGYWTDKVARRVWLHSSESQRVLLEKVVESYGYFGMGPFLIPGIRWSKVSWFIERYIEARVKFPGATFHFVGHSHGTYLLAKALEEYHQIKFQNVVFAGSIVRENFDWEQLIKKKQVARILNLVATADWVVAFFPRSFDLYNLQDLGGAGHRGFEQGQQLDPDALDSLQASTPKDKTALPEEGRIFNLKYARGDHGAGRAEPFWDLIARFVMLRNRGDWKAIKLPNEDVTSQSLGLFLVSLFSWGNVAVWTTIGAIIFLIPAFILKWLPDQLSIPVWFDTVKPLVIAASFLLVSWVYIRISTSQPIFNTPKFESLIFNGLPTLEISSGTTFS